MANDLSGFGLREHPLRGALSNEMHVRKLPPVSVPARLMQVVLSRRDGSQGELERLAELSGRTPEVLRQGRYLSCKFGGLHLVWERHSESSTYLFVRPGAFETPFDAAAFGDVPAGWFDGLGLEVVRATQIAITADADETKVARHFSEDDLIVCDLAGGAARMFSDFLIHPDGFGRLLIQDRGLERSETALLLQRLQDHGNYRNMALLGLPVAQRHTPRVTELEQRLSTLTAAVAEGAQSDEAMLSDLSALSAELAAIVAQTRYRMSASRAYAEISQERLAALRVSRVRGYLTLTDFTDRRLLPAVRTCVSFSSRLDDLSQRVAWTTSLLRTRVDTALSRQNRDLLRSMDRRTDLQLRLQQTVEGVSVVAIAYYLIGLAAFVLKGAEARLPVPHTIAVALLVPVILFVVAWGAYRARKRLTARAERGGH